VLKEVGIGDCVAQKKKKRCGGVARPERSRSSIKKRTEEKTGNESEAVSKAFKWITVDPKVCHGKPVFKGTRVLVSDVLEMLSEGMTIDEILEEYPQLNKEMILEAIALAAELLRRERRVIPLPA